MRLVIRGVLAVLVLAAGPVAAFFPSPWPGVMAIRAIFDRGTVATSAAPEKHLPPGIVADLGMVPDGAGPARPFDVCRAADAGDGARPAIVRVHGGAFVYGDRSDVGSCLRVLAARGFITVAVGCTIAPGGRFPAPVAEVNAALGYLSADAARFGTDPARSVLAGDSAGAQIAAQAATSRPRPRRRPRSGSPRRSRPPRSAARSASAAPTISTLPARRAARGRSSSTWCCAPTGAADGRRRP